MKEIFPLPEPRNDDLIAQIIEILRDLEKQAGIKTNYMSVKKAKNEVHIIGAENQVNKAKRLLQDLIGKELERQKHTLKVPLPADKTGVVMGEGGRRVKEIEKRTSTTIDVKGKCAYIRGQVQAHREQAASDIQEIVKNLSSLTTDGKTKISIPPGCKLGLVIGKNHSNLTKIKEKTGASVHVINNELYIVSGNDKERQAAIIEVKSKMANICNKKPLPEQFNFLLATKSADYKLQEFDCPNPFWNGEKHFKVYTMDDHGKARDEDLNTEELQTFVREVLEKVRQENKDKEVKADFFCHFGHLFIGNIDEEDQKKPYTLSALKEEFKKNKKESWKLRFNPAIEELKFKELEKTLQGLLQKDNGSCTVDPHIRHDFQFYTPYCTSIRAKIFIDMDGNIDSTFSHEDIDIRKNDPKQESEASPAPQFMLCDQFQTRARVNIMILSEGMDCRLAIRTVSPNEDHQGKSEEFEKNVTKYLDKISFADKELCMPSEQMPGNPGDYCLYYWRKCHRRSYPFNVDGEGFSITISEEDIMDVTGSDKKESTKTDIHLHCDEWDKLLTSGKWEPEQIVEKLPQFLTFVRDVQSYISQKHE